MTNEERVVLYEGRFLRLIKCGRWEYVERTNASGATVIVAVTDEGKLLLIEQYRVPMGRRIIELPAGLVGDVPGKETEGMATSARRELLEETGYEATEMMALTSGPPTAGLATEVVTFFRATGLRKVHAAGTGDGHEEIQLHEVPLAEAARWLEEKAAAGLMVDPKVYAGLYFAGEGGPNPRSRGGMAARRRKTGRSNRE
jgi:ADP-ribose pyrophosphatase